MKRLLPFLLIGLLAGCVAAPQPFASPLAQAEPVTRIYLPIFYPAQPWAGVSQDLAYRSCAAVQALGATWHYDWSPYPLQCAGSEAVPMLWAPGDGQAGPLPPSEYLLIFNECDRRGQCDTDPETAARWWRAYEAQYPDRKLVGPNASHEGLAWLLAWHEAYIRLYGEAPRLWALGVHCYMPVAECQRWVDLNGELARTWTESGKIWLTEWAMTDCYIPGGTAAAVAAAETFTRWLAEHSAVERQAWFIAQMPGQRCATALLDGAGAPTAFGAWWQAGAGDR